MFKKPEAGSKIDIFLFCSFWGDGCILWLSFAQQIRCEDINKSFTVYMYVDRTRTHDRRSRANVDYHSHAAQAYTKTLATKAFLINVAILTSILTDSKFLAKNNCNVRKIFFEENLKKIAESAKMQFCL
jgi:hypothetical protein